MWTKPLWIVEILLFWRFQKSLLVYEIRLINIKPKHARQKIWVNFWSVRPVLK